MRGSYEISRRSKYSAKKRRAKNEQLAGNRHAAAPRARFAAHRIARLAARPGGARESSIAQAARGRWHSGGIEMSWQSSCSSSEIKRIYTGILYAHPRQPVGEAMVIGERNSARLVEAVGTFGAYL